MPTEFPPGCRTIINEVVDFDKCPVVFYVSKERGNDDDNDGSPYKPFQTIGKAIAVGNALPDPLLYQFAIIIDGADYRSEGSIAFSEGRFSITGIGGLTGTRYTWIPEITAFDGHLFLDNVQTEDISGLGTLHMEECDFGDSDLSGCGSAVFMNSRCVYSASRLPSSWAGLLFDDSAGNLYIRNFGTPVKNVVIQKSGSINLQSGETFKINGSPHTHEGTEIKSTGETGAVKFLREDGDGSCSWQNVPGGYTLPDDIEDGGSAEMNVDGLSGELADPQKQKVQNIGGTQLYSTSTSWVTFFRFIFRGTTEMGTPTNIKLLLARAGFGSTTLNARIVDADNGDAVICSISNVDPGAEPNFSKQDMGSLSNLPTAEHIFEVQIQKASGGGGNEVHCCGGVVEW